jgi:hypothetical protein
VPGTVWAQPFRLRPAGGTLLDAGVEKVYSQQLVPENAKMTELLADTLKRL